MVCDKDEKHEQLMQMLEKYFSEGGEIPEEDSDEEMDLVNRLISMNDGEDDEIDGEDDEFNDSDDDMEEDDVPMKEKSEKSPKKLDKDKRKQLAIMVVAKRAGKPKAM